MQARVFARGAPPAARARRRCASSSLKLDAPPPRPLPPQQQEQPSAEPAPPPPLRQLYPFEASSSAAPAGRSAPLPLLAGSLPGAAKAKATTTTEDANNADNANNDPHHRFYFEVRGNPLGLPCLVLHGGPGAGSYPSHARFFDPSRCCVVLLDQRGCGRSTPLGRLGANDAPSLLRDVERLRLHLGVSAWACVLGGSWGSALGLRYALDAPVGVVRALVLRAVCTMRPGREEVGWIYRGGAGPLLRPEAWRAFLAHVGMTPGAHGVDPLPAYYERLLSAHPARRDAAASAWMAYEWAVYSTRADDEALLSAAADAPATATARDPPSSSSQLPPDLAARGLAFPGVAPPGTPPTRADHTAAQALLLCHYSLHGGFLNGDEGGGEAGPSLLERVRAAASGSGGRLAGVACCAFHGAADAVCPLRNARDLQRAWPGARVEVLPGLVGHSMYDPALVDAVVRATDEAADAAAAAADADGGSFPLRAARLPALIEAERARRDADVALAAAALTRA